MDDNSEILLINAAANFIRLRRNAAVTLGYERMSSIIHNHLQLHRVFLSPTLLQNVELQNYLSFAIKNAQARVSQSDRDVQTLEAMVKLNNEWSPLLQRTSLRMDHELRITCSRHLTCSCGINDETGAPRSLLSGSDQSRRQTTRPECTLANPQV